MGGGGWVVGDYQIKCKSQFKLDLTGTGTELSLAKMEIEKDSGSKIYFVNHIFDSKQHVFIQMKLTTRVLNCFGF